MTIGWWAMIGFAVGGLSLGWFDQPAQADSGAGASPQTPEQVVPGDLEEKDRELRLLQAQDREKWLRKREDEKERGKRLLEQEEKERQRQLQLRAERVKAVDPLLRKAWLGYDDSEKRDRQKVEQMFLEYLKRKPDSVFTPEIYYRIGSMYSNNANSKIGETLDRQKRDHYFTKALEGYGAAFAVEADAARSFLAGRREVPLDARLDYYDWLIGFEKKGGPDAVHPIQRISEHVTYGEPAQMTEEEMSQRVAFLRRYLTAVVPAVEHNLILRMARTPAEWKRIAERYPGRRIGEAAGRRLKEWHEKNLDVDAVLESEMFTEPIPTPLRSPSDDRRAEKAAPTRAPLAQAEGRGNTAKLLAFILGGVIVIGVVLVAGVVLRRSKRPGGS